jgi:hypothetical protein
MKSNEIFVVIDLQEICNFCICMQFVECKPALWVCDIYRPRALNFQFGGNNQLITHNRNIKFGVHIMNMPKHYLKYCMHVKNYKHTTGAKIYFTWISLQPWRCKQYGPLKYQALSALHSIKLRRLYWFLILPVKICSSESYPQKWITEDYKH